jgi:hypothetical protein
MAISYSQSSIFYPQSSIRDLLSSILNVLPVPFSHSPRRPPDPCLDSMPCRVKNRLSVFR